MENSYQKLERIRKPRVHIKYDVETEGTTVVKELPFVVGVLGDFSGDAAEPLKPLKNRKFVQIDRDNFDVVMQCMAPGLNLRVENTLQDNDSEMVVNLRFNSMEDFSPAKIVGQVPALKVLLDTRNKLRDLLTRIDCSEELENLLELVLKNPNELQRLSAELGIETSANNKE